jgi:hypothetical protein
MDSDLDTFSDSDDGDDGFFNADPFGFLPRLMYVFHQQHLHRPQARHFHRPPRNTGIPSTPVNGKRPEYNVHYSPNSVAKCQKCKKAIQEGSLQQHFFPSRNPLHTRYSRPRFCRFFFFFFWGDVF